MFFCLRPHDNLPSHGAAKKVSQQHLFSAFKGVNSHWAGALSKQSWIPMALPPLLLENDRLTAHKSRIEERCGPGAWTYCLLFLPTGLDTV